MNTCKTPPVNVVAMRAEEYSDEEEKSLIISLTTKFSGAERKYSVPLECFYNLMIDLQRLHAYCRVDSQLLALIRNRRKNDPTNNLGSSKLERICSLASTAALRPDQEPAHHFHSKIVSFAPSVSDTAYKAEGIE